VSTFTISLRQTILKYDMSEQKVKHLIERTTNEGRRMNLSLEDFIEFI